MILQSLVLCCLLFQSVANEVYLGHAGYTGISDQDIISYLDTSAGLADRGHQFIQHLRRQSDQGSSFHDPALPGSRGLVLLWDTEKFRPEIGSYRSISERPAVEKYLSAESTTGNRILKVTAPKENQWVHSIHFAQPVPTLENGKAGFTNRASEKPIFQIFHRLEEEILYTARSPMIHKRTPPAVSEDSSVTAFVEVQTNRIATVLKTRLSTAMAAEISTQQQRFNEEEDLAFLLKAVSLDLYKSFLDSFNADDSKMAGKSRLNEESATVTGQISFENYAMLLAGSPRRTKRHFAASSDNELFCFWLSINPEQFLGPSIKRRLEKISNTELKEALAVACRMRNLELCVTMNSDGLLAGGLYSSEIHHLAGLMTWLTNLDSKVNAHFDENFLWIGSLDNPEADKRRSSGESIEVDYVAKLVIATDAISSADLPNAPEQMLQSLMKTAVMFEGSQPDQHSKFVLHKEGSNLKLNFDLDRTMLRAISMLFLQFQ